jgi:predicted transcriptional regulator
MKKTILSFLLSVFTFSAFSHQFEWVKMIRGLHIQINESMTIDKQGNLYGIGRFSYTGDFDPGPGTFNLVANGTWSAGSTDIYIVKLDKNGDFKWAKSMGSKKYDAGFNIQVDQDGNVYSIGVVGDTTDFDPGVGVYNLVNQPNISYTYLQKLDSNGNFLWAKIIGEGGSASGTSLLLDSTQHIYISGSFYGSCDFDPSAASFLLTTSSLLPSSAQCFIAKYDTSGAFIWARQTQSVSNGNAGINSMAQGSDGAFYLGGAYNYVVDFDPGIGVQSANTNGTQDGFILKLDSLGQFVWFKTINSTKDLFVHHVHRSKTGGIHLAVGYEGVADLDPGPNVFIDSTEYFLQRNVAMIKLDEQGDTKWVKGWKGSVNYLDSVNVIHMRSITTNNDGDIYFTGNFFDTIDFDPGASIYNLISTTNSYEPYIAVLDSNGAFKSVLEFNSSGLGGISTSTNLMLDSIGNLFAAGTIESSTIDFDPGPATTLIIPSFYDGFFLKLGICSNTVNVSQNNDTLTCNSTNATYQWLTCPSMLPISGATNAVYVATSNGSYAVAINTGCIDTSLCFMVGGLATSNLMDDYQINIIPNPTSSFFKIISTEAFQQADVYLYSAIGVKVFEQHQINVKEFVLDVNNYPSGIYILEIRDGGKRVRRKVIKL